MSVRRRTRGLYQLARPGNVVGATVLAAVGAYVAAGATVSVPVAAALCATGLATAAGNAINDYFDREIDRINRPDRPIPAGRVRPATARRLAVVAFAVAVALTLALLPPVAIAIALVNLVLLTAYTTHLKGTPGLGNGVVAFLVASALWFGGAAAGDAPATLEIGVLAGVATFAREVIKDIEDLPGDRAAGLATLPVAVGPRRAWHVAGAVLALGAALSPLPYLQGTLGWWYLLALAPALAVMGYGVAVGRARPARGQRLLKVGMYVALVAFVLGRLQHAL